MIKNTQTNVGQKNKNKKITTKKQLTLMLT